MAQKLMYFKDPKALWALLKDTAAEWNQDQVPRLGAALAYYTVWHGSTYCGLG
jgi:uncharacterized BrkB/YihY/UPF0761 family membrane protein